LHGEEYGAWPIKQVSDCVFPKRRSTRLLLLLLLKSAKHADRSCLVSPSADCRAIKFDEWRRYRPYVFSSLPTVVVRRLPWPVSELWSLTPLPVRLLKTVDGWMSSWMLNSETPVFVCVKCGAAVTLSRQRNTKKLKQI